MIKSYLPAKRHRRANRYVPLFLWIGVVLFVSTTQGAMQNTSRVILPLLKFFFPNTPEQILIGYHGYIRKLAHFTEYAILAFWAARAFSTSSIKLLQKFWFAFSIAAVLLVASVDEYNQSFNSLRTGSIYDVMLDCLGGVVMIAFFAVYKTGKK